MVDFGRVTGVVERLDDANGEVLVLTVTLETRDTVTVVRRQTLDPVRPIHGHADLVWHADQWTQETIGVDLAEQGWEVLGVSDLEADTPSGTHRSPAYSVRRLFTPAGAETHRGPSA